MHSIQEHTETVKTQHALCITDEALHLYGILPLHLKRIHETQQQIYIYIYICIQKRNGISDKSGPQVPPYTSNKESDYLTEL